jgi:hypothetical protein
LPAANPVKDLIISAASSSLFHNRHAGASATVVAYWGGALRSGATLIKPRHVPLILRRRFHGLCWIGCRSSFFSREIFFEAVVVVLDRRLSVARAVDVTAVSVFHAIVSEQVVHRSSVL